jgi:hypothetical protein
MRAGNQVLLLWEPFPGAPGYRVVRKDLSTGQEVRWDSAGTQSTDRETVPDHSYSYTIRVLLTGGVEGPTSVARTVSGVRPLAPPKGLQAYQEGAHVHLVWESVEGAAFYNVYRGQEGKPPALIASGREVKYVDTSGKAGSSYTYRVRAVAVDGRESGDSPVFRVSVIATQESGTKEGVERRYVEVVRRIHKGSQYLLKEPTDLVFSRGTLFVTDLGSRSVLALDPEGDLLGQFGAMPQEYPGVWGIPWGIGVSADGSKVAVTFLRSSNVRVFSRDGKLLRDLVVGKPPEFEENPATSQPMDVVFDARGDLWVTEYAYAQVVHLGPEGRELGRVGSPRQAAAAGPFRNPTFIASDAPTEHLFVVDSLRSAVFGIEGGGEAIWIWDRPRASEAAMYLPKGVAVQGPNRLLVVDGLTSSLLGFTFGGVIEAVYYSKDRQFLDLRSLVSVDIDPASGDIYALSKVDGAIYRLRVVESAPAK